LSDIVFDPVLFREQFPAFSCDAHYTDAMLQMMWDMAVCYISDCNYGCLQGNCRQLAINLMTAHLQYISDKAVNGATTGFVTSATIDKVSVSTQAPPATNQTFFNWWLSQTPYGQQLLALLKAKSVGGLYIGGLPERSAFRKVGGIF